MTVKEIMDKLNSTKTVEEMNDLWDELQKAEQKDINFLTNAEKFYVMNALNEHEQHLKNPCYEGE